MPELIKAVEELEWLCALLPTLVNLFYQAACLVLSLIPDTQYQAGYQADDTQPVGFGCWSSGLSLKSDEGRRLLLHRFPQPVQAECVPLILGGGDVLAAAETGSGEACACHTSPAVKVRDLTCSFRQNWSLCAPYLADSPRGSHTGCGTFSHQLKQVATLASVPQLLAATACRQAPVWKHSVAILPIQSQLSWWNLRQFAVVSSLQPPSERSGR